MEYLGLDKIEAATDDYQTVTPGGYYARIYAAYDRPDKKYLELWLDIADGEFKGHYKELYDKLDFWPLKTFRSYKNEQAKKFFKGFVDTVAEVNKRFVFKDGTPDAERAFVGQYIGIVLSEEEYESNDGEIKTRLYVSAIKTIETIKHGDFKVKPKKLLKVAEGAETKTASKAAAMEEVDDDLPF